jgi:glycerate 2-kinase
MTSSVSVKPTSVVVAAPNALKGVLSARAAADALAGGFERAGVPCERVPVADGGEGTAEAFRSGLGGEWLDADASDALGRPIVARFLRTPDGPVVLEAAEAIGLWRLASEERDPLRATSRGFGELVLAAVEAGAPELVAGVGGVATVDGGAGLREVVRSLPVPTTVACDVSNPLLGEHGAARVFGPQKGASPADVEELERRLETMEVLAPYAHVPGAGAAGGLGAALAALGARLVPGAELVLEAIRFRDRIRKAALVVTGEGEVDRTTAGGKAPGAVARVCADEGVRCVLFGGRVVEPLAGVETRALSGDPARAERDLGVLGEELAGTL